MNNVTLIGRLVKDPECRVSTTGRAITSFMLAVGRDFKNAEGKYDADFIPCTAFGKTGEVVGNNFNKGQRMGCIGRLQIDIVDGKDGQKRSFAKVIVDKVDFIERKDSNQGGGFGDMGTPQADISGFGG